jgi:hypothetical protein
VQCFQPSQDVERHILEATITGWSVPRFVKMDVFEPVPGYDDDSLLDQLRVAAGVR